jgi:hypothetical protein
MAKRMCCAEEGRMTSADNGWTFFHLPFAFGETASTSYGDSAATMGKERYGPDSGVDAASHLGTIWRLILVLED